MADYTTVAADALASVTEAGTAVTFTYRTPGTYANGTWSGAATATVSGYAVRVKGDPIVYAALSLIEGEAPTLLFAPSTYGQQPSMGSTVTWGSVTYTVRSVNPVQPDGSTLLCRVVVSA